MAIHIIPLKNGLWRVVCVTDNHNVPTPIGSVRLSTSLYSLWLIAYRRWWATNGNRLSISPEMWVE